MVRHQSFESLPARFGKSNPRHTCGKGMSKLLREIVTPAVSSCGGWALLFIVGGVLKIEGGYSNFSSTYSFPQY